MHSTIYNIYMHSTIHNTYMHSTIHRIYKIIVDITIVIYRDTCDSCLLQLYMSYRNIQLEN